MSLNHSPAIVTDGLVLCLDAANIRSYPRTGTTWTDLSTSGTNGSMEGMSSSNYSTNNAGVMDFDGADDYIDVGSGLISGTNNNFSVSFWASPDALPGNNQARGLFSWGSNAIGSNGLVCYFENLQNSNRVALQKNGNGIYFSNWYYPTIGEWFNFVYTFNSSASNLSTTYSNGEFLGTTTAGTSPGSLGTLKFGGGKGNLNGKMNNLMFYNRALTGDEVRQNYEATVGRYT
jgi:hypothetical protein